MPKPYATGLDGAAIEYEIEYEIVRSRRRTRTIEISVNPRGGVRVSAPLRSTHEEIRAVVERRSEWIARHQRATVPLPVREFVSGESLLYLGWPVPLVVEAVERTRVTVELQSDHFHIRVPAILEGNERLAAVERAVMRWFSERAAAYLDQRVALWAQAGGRPPARVLVRNQRRRWGSCAPDGTLRFNWRIVMAEPSIIDYVVVHELAHLAVHDHSPAFWAEVERILPDYRARKAALKRAGPTLTL